MDIDALPPHVFIKEILPHLDPDSAARVLKKRHWLALSSDERCRILTKDGRRCCNRTAYQIDPSASWLCDDYCFGKCPVAVLACPIFKSQNTGWISKMAAKLKQGSMETPFVGKVTRVAVDSGVSFIMGSTIVDHDGRSLSSIDQVIRACKNKPNVSIRWVVPRNVVQAMDRRKPLTIVFKTSGRVWLELELHRDWEIVSDSNPTIIKGSVKSAVPHPPRR